MKECVNKPKVALDLDGVIANTGKLIEDSIIKKGYKASFETYHPSILGVKDSRSIMTEVIDDMFYNRMNELEPYDQVNDNMFTELNILADITILTARRKEFNDLTKKWLNKHFPLTKFELVNMSSKHKPQYVKDKGFIAFVEDRLRTANLSARMGNPTYLIYRRWNTGRRTEKNITRISSLSTLSTLLATRGTFPHIN